MPQRRTPKGVAADVNVRFGKANEMAQITQEQRALLQKAGAPAGHQRRYEASPAEVTSDVSGYIQGVAAIIVPPHGTMRDAERSAQ